MATNESNGSEGLGGGFDISASEKNVHVLSIASGCGIDGCDPGGDGIAAGNRVGDAGGLEGLGGSEEAFTDEFHGTHHPV